MWAKEWEEALDEGEKRRLSFLLLVWSSFYYYNTSKEKMRESILQRLVRGEERKKFLYIYFIGHCRVNCRAVRSSCRRPAAAAAAAAVSRHQSQNHENKNNTTSKTFLSLDIYIFIYGVDSIYMTVYNK